MEKSFVLFHLFDNSEAEENERALTIIYSLGAAFILDEFVI